MANVIEDELETYLAWLHSTVQLIVIDASPPDLFAIHASRWPMAVHLPPDPRVHTLNAKAWGVLTGLQHVAHDRVIVADDDVRYDAAGLERVVRMLDEAEVVRPQNYFSPSPWHARWDTARILLNRVTGGDWPGTLAFHRSFLAQGYDGNCLFENLQLVRTVVAAGGRECVALDLYVRRVPPTAGHFFSQRVRQAYDEWARPLRLVIQLALLPAVLLASLRKPQLVPMFSVIAMMAAEVGRRRQGGSAYFPATASLMAPLWLAERGVCAWLALGTRMLTGGVLYHGAIVSRPATSVDEIRRRWRQPRAGREAR